MPITKTPILKDVYTKSLYQSTFMPIFQRAETKIKSLIFTAFLYGRSRYFLLLAIAEVIREVDKKIPADLHDRDQYLRGLQASSQYMVREYYEKPQAAFTEVREKILGSVTKDIKAPKVENPKQVLDLIDSKKLWSEAKGYPNVVNYPTEVKLKLNQLAQQPMVTREPGKKPITLWQKAELDVRYESNMQDIQDLRVQGVNYAWLSSHPNCSKRCAAWQGKLVALEGHAPSPQTVVDHKSFNYTKSRYFMHKVDGIPVYSLSDIMATVDDKYGYHNNIISGFNCRHHLIPYTPGSVAKLNQRFANLSARLD